MSAAAEGCLSVLEEEKRENGRGARGQVQADCDGCNREHGKERLRTPVGRRLGLGGEKWQRKIGF